jgi:hypothetical protein
LSTSLLPSTCSGPEVIPLDEDAVEDELLAAEVVAGAPDVALVELDVVEFVDVLPPPEVLVVDVEAVVVDVPFDAVAPPLPPEPL